MQNLYPSDRKTFSTIRRFGVLKMKLYRVTYKFYYRLETYPGCTKTPADGTNTILCYNTHSSREDKEDYGADYMQILREGIKYRLIDTCVTYLPVYNFCRLLQSGRDVWTKSQGIFKYNCLVYYHKYSHINPASANYTYIAECISIPDFAETVDANLLFYLNSESHLYSKTHLPDNVYSSSIRNELVSMWKVDSCAPPKFATHKTCSALVTRIPELWTTFVNMPKLHVMCVYMTELKLTFLRIEKLELLLMHTKVDWGAHIYYAELEPLVNCRDSTLRLFSCGMNIEVAQDERGHSIRICNSEFTAELSNRECQEIVMRTSPFCRLVHTFSTAYKADWIAHIGTISCTC